MNNRKKHNIIVFIAGLFLLGTCLQGQQTHQHQNEIRREERNRNRWHWQMPIRVMDEIGIKEGMTVADVGAGDGYFTFHLSERVGKEGRVYANDIDNRALQVIRDKCKKDGIKNISVILGEEDDPLLPAECVDLAIMVNVIHLVENPTVFLKNVAKCLKPEAKLVIVQWDEEKMGYELKGWSSEDRKRYTLRANLRMIYDADFEVLQILNFLPLQLIYVCQPFKKRM